MDDEATGIVHRLSSIVCCPSATLNRPWSRTQVLASCRRCMAYNLLREMNNVRQIAQGGSNAKIGVLRLHCFCCGSSSIASVASSEWLLRIQSEWRCTCNRFNTVGHAHPC